MSPYQITHFFDVVAGLAYPNRDGSDRIQTALECKPCEQLDLIPEPDNPFDPNAVAVVRESGHQIGYLPKELAAIVTHEIAQGWQYIAFVWSLGDDTPPYTAFGIELVILRITPGSTDEEVQAYIDRISDRAGTCIRPSATAPVPGAGPSGCMPNQQPSAIGPSNAGQDRFSNPIPGSKTDSITITQRLR